MSPAAQTPSRGRRQVGPQATPPLSPSSRPADRASITSGTAPVPITTRSAVDDAAGGGDHALDAVPALEALQASARHQLDALAREQVGEEPARGRAELRDERRVLEHDHRAAPPERRQRRGDLAGDVGAADRARPARRPARRRGSRRRCRARAGSGCRRAARRPRAGAGRSRRWPAAPCRTRRPPSWRASPCAPPCRASSRSCAWQLEFSCVPGVVVEQAGVRGPSCPAR